MIAGVEKDFLDFLELVEPIPKACKLGFLIVELQPDFTYCKKVSLETFFNLLPQAIHFAVEFQRESFFGEEIWNLLKKHNVPNPITDSASELLKSAIEATTTHTYVK